VVVAAVLLVAAAVAGADATASVSRFTGDVLFPIYVSDVEVSAAFYRDVLGFEFLGYWDYEADGYVATWVDTMPPRYAGFVAGGQKFGLHKPASESQEQCVGCGRYYFRVVDVEEEHSRISGHGVPISPVHSSSLLKRFYVPDPDGLQVFFAETAEGAPVSPW
jgi:predicted enzyme related to lactoylglutathione lyase